MQVHLLVVDPLAIDEVLVLARRVVLVVNLVVSSDIYSSTIPSSSFGYIAFIPFICHFF